MLRWVERHAETLASCSLRVLTAMHTRSRPRLLAVETPLSALDKPRTSRHHASASITAGSFGPYLRVRGTSVATGVAAPGTDVADRFDGVAIFLSAFHLL